MTDGDPDREGGDPPPTGATEGPADPGRGSGAPEPPGAPAEGVLAAEHYREAAADRPERVREDLDRVVGLLDCEAAPGPDLRRRAAAAGALAVLAESDPAPLAGRLPTLLAELDRALDRDPPAPDLRDRSRAVVDRLAYAAGRALAETPSAADLPSPAGDGPDGGSGDGADGGGADGGSAPAPDRGSTPEPDLGVLGRAATAAATDGARRAVVRSLFVVAADRPGAVAPAADRLGDCLDADDDAVRAWATGALGRVAADRPGAVAPVADRLGDCLDADDGRVRHNAAEALATLAGDRPGAVRPAADRLRDCLDAGATACRHNAAGALGRLAGEHPDAVRPAVDRLRALRRDDEPPAVRRVATAALARLADVDDAGAGPDADDAGG